MPDVGLTREELLHSVLQLRNEVKLLRKQLLNEKNMNRKWFAGMALQALISNQNPIVRKTKSEIIEDAYKFADGMLGG